MKLLIAILVSVSMNAAFAQAGNVSGAGGNVAVPQSSGSMGTDTATGANRPTNTNAGRNPNNRPSSSDTGTNPRTGTPNVGAPATTPANQPSTNTNTITP